MRDNSFDNTGVKVNVQDEGEKVVVDKSVHHIGFMIPILSEEIIAACKEQSL